ncbi:MAG: acyl-CoA reductase [Bacteroidota bacterium]
MNFAELRHRRLESLVSLGKFLQKQPIPPQVIHQACEVNPWFTPYYIAHALQGIATWFQPDILFRFSEKYPQYPSKPQTIGIIAAGNVPFVGFHDVMIALLSGHRVLLKPSHQDRVLIKWLLSAWQDRTQESLPIEFTESRFLTCDYLIATGSNNTARYLHTHYRDFPRLIRHNRYSVAVIDEEMNEAAWEGLREDMFLYNGLGCRNVSNLIISPSQDLWDIREKINEYASERVNPHYLERILFLKAKEGVHTNHFVHSDFGIFVEKDYLASAPMGVFHYVKISDQVQLKALLEVHRSDIQCVVGNQTPFGEAQKPRIEDFADNVDTMKILTEI